MIYRDIFVLTIAAAVGGMAIHELTHWAVARVLGAEAKIVLHDPDVPTWAVWAWSPHVGYWVDEDERWKNRVVGLSPLLVGVVAGGAVIANGVPEFGVGQVPSITFGLIYVLGGGLSDYSVAISRGERTLGERLTTAEKQFIATFALWGLGAVVMEAKPLIMEQGWGQAAEWYLTGLVANVGLAMYFSSVCVAIMAAYNAKQLDETHWLKRPIREVLKEKASGFGLRRV